MYTTLRCEKASSRDAVIVVFITQATKPAAADAPPEWREAMAQAVKRPDVSGEPGEITRHDTGDRRLLIVGLGDAESFTPRRVRAAGGQVAAQLHRMRATAARISVGPSAARLMPAPDFARAFAQGVCLGSFVYDEFKKDARRNGPTVLTLDAGDPDLNTQVQRGLDHADSANYTRRLAATPPNIATPAFIADEANRLAKAADLKCTVFNGKQLETHKFVGLANVGRASNSPPCLIELIYTPKKKATATIVLVGKTITFDSGGLSLKINNSMRHMKYDKCGGMAVLGAMRHIAALKPACKVVALLPAAENMVDATAYRPDDIIRYANGVTVEVTNTDAEGRLVLADALVYACKHHKPDVLIDLATLTGGVVTALGNVTAGFWSTHDDLTAKLRAASDASGEAIWLMPIQPEHREAMKSDHADITNSINKPAASPCMGAAFLERFVEKGTKWAHLDIAGAAVADSPNPPIATGPTGFGARLLMELIEAWV